MRMGQQLAREAFGASSRDQETEHESHLLTVRAREGDRRETGGRQEGDRRETGGRRERDRRETGGKQEADRRQTGGRTRKSPPHGDRPSGEESSLLLLAVQGCLAHKNPPPSLGPPYGPRHSLTVGAQEGVVSYERGTPVMRPGRHRVMCSASLLGLFHLLFHHVIPSYPPGVSVAARVTFAAEQDT